MSRDPWTRRRCGLLGLGAVAGVLAGGLVDVACAAGGDWRAVAALDS